MRTRMLILTGALLVASAGLAQAQDTTPTATKTPAATASQALTPQAGTVDFGYRGSSFTGDEARYNRQRDLRDGAYVNRFRFDKETETTAFRATANNVGYRDQQYFVGLESIGRLKASFDWVSNPLFQAQARGLYSGAGTATQSIDPVIRSAIQNGTLTQAQAFAQFAKPYDIKSRRDVARFDATYTATRDLDFKVDVRNTMRDGSNLMAFGFGNSPGNMVVLDQAVPVNDRTTDVKAKMEWANRKGVVAVGWDSSYYNQHNPVYQWDNPLRATDTTTGPAFGKTSLWPSNDANSINVAGSYKLPARSKATAAISYGTWNQNQSLLPNTTNTALVGVSPLERTTAEAKANITSMVYGFNSRPIQDLWLNAKFRYYNYDNKTPEFTNTVVPGDYGIGPLETTEPASFKRKTLDLDANYGLFGYLNVGAGFTREDADRTFRMYESTSENVFRATVDSTGNQYVTARLKYEYAKRDGQGLDEEMLTEIGEHPELRQFDIASRDRHRVTAMFTVTPVSFFDVNASVFDGRDKYPDAYFGLQDNKNRGYGIGFDLIPVNTVNFGLDYEYERYSTLQWSRTANPLSATDQTFLDPRRDWSNSIKDEVKTFSANLDLLKAVRKTDIRLGYDLSDGNTNYTYGLAAVTTLTNPVQYTTQPKNKIQVAKADVQYYIRPNVAFGGAYWYEQYKVQDFAFDPVLMSQGALTNGLYSGYAYRPYKAHTGFVRMTYLW